MSAKLVEDNVGTSSTSNSSPSKNEAYGTRGIIHTEGACNAQDPWGHDVRVYGGRNFEPRALVDDEQLSRKGIRVKTEVTLISTERLEYRDQLF